MFVNKVLWMKCLGGVILMRVIIIVMNKFKIKEMIVKGKEM